ncbi:hypothetical protein KDC22_19885 [Paenibacillus tritici]|uniref:hypothetical protein n=1 Tax=Paenibacillus tritici TaxID=1873425 RepID=UPI001BAD1AC5|nr:hypothetical protein [Paenibacillus tritici]QUL52694.1 hypothetical protein KDC22_19885 [Paenibacillus tritici]
MNRRYGSTLILLVLNVLGVFAVDITTFKYRIGRGISGNGNPGIIALIISLTLLAILFILLVFISIDYLRKLPRKFTMIVIPSLSMVTIVFMIFGELNKMNVLEQNLKGFTNDKDSVVFRFGWINQYTNTLFYNGYILGFGISLAILVSCLIVRIQSIDT